MNKVKYTDDRIDQMLRNMAKGTVPVTFTFRNESEQEQNRTKKGSNIMLFRKVIPFAAAFAFVIAAAVVGTHFLKKDVPVTPADPSATNVTSVTEKQEDVGKKGSNGIWEYTEYAESVTLTRYLAAAPGDTIEKLTIPESITNKPVTDMAEELFNDLYKKQIFIYAWNVSEYNKYFSIDDAGVLYNKDKTIIFCLNASFNGDGIDQDEKGNIVPMEGFTEIQISENVTKIYLSEYSNVLFKINVDKNNKYYCSENGALFTKDKSTLLVLPAAAVPKDLSYSIPDGVKNIERSSFHSATAVSYIKIPESVSSIADGAFRCTFLKEINVDKNNKHFSSVNGILFNKDQTTLIAFPREHDVTSYTVPNTVNKIDVEAFLDCYELKNVIIPNTVKHISSNAFNVLDITITGSTGSYAEKYAKENNIPFIAQ